MLNRTNRSLWTVSLAALMSLGTAGLSAEEILRPAFHLPTSGAREIEPFEIDGRTFLAVAQLAEDIPGTTPNMNGGNSDVDVVIYRPQPDGSYAEYQRLPSHGNESVRFFTIARMKFLAVGSIRSGTDGNYDMESYSTLYRWDGLRFYPVQLFPGLATKQAYPFSIGDRHFLGLASGVTTEESGSKLSPNSQLYEIHRGKFQPFQQFDSQWAYGWHHFTIGDRQFLTLTDHLGPSTIFQWDGEQFEPFQTIDQPGGRAFTSFTVGEEKFLAFANIDHPSTIYRWDGERFVKFQELPDLGGRNFCHFRSGEENYLLQVLFIAGTRESPQAVRQSPLYRWNGTRFEVAQRIETSGGVSASAFVSGDRQYVAIANSLSAEIRFRVDSVIYEVVRRDATEFTSVED